MKTIATVLASLILPLTAARVCFAQSYCGPIEGYADLHSHLMAEYQFGGSWFWGSNHGPIEAAVPRCDGGMVVADLLFWEEVPIWFNDSHAATVLGAGTELVGRFHGLSNGDVGLHLGKRRGHDNRECQYLKVLGQNILEIPGTCPRKQFEDWPSWDSIAHQQMWDGWIRDAFAGGMKVLVASLADSEFLCSVTPPGRRRFGCDEMASVRRQLSAVNEFAAANASWLEIAKTPGDVRRIVQQEGKLALVLAVEITHLFPTGDIASQVQEFYDAGVRSIQLVHHANNRFAGVAPINKVVEAAHRVESAGQTLDNFVDLFNVLDARTLLSALGAQQSLRLLPFLPDWSVLAGIHSPLDDVICRDPAGNQLDCDGAAGLNERGLTADGRILVQEMMKRGMLIDVSHVSRKTLRDVNGILASADYPMFASHYHMSHTFQGPEDAYNEKYLADDEIDMFANGRGMLGLRTGPEQTHEYAPSGVENSCQGSSRSFAQSLAYAVDTGLTVGFAPDLNGFAQQMLPRNGSSQESCWGNHAEQAQQAPTRTGTSFDEQGLGHEGLLPELMSDLQVVGLRQPYLDHLNRSAENFVRMWSRAERLPDDACIPSCIRLMPDQQTSDFAGGSLGGGGSVSIRDVHVAQTFVPSLTSISWASMFSVDYDVVSQPTATATLQLIIHEGEGLQGPVVGMSDQETFNNRFGVVGFGTIDFDFSSPVAVVPGQTYTMEVIELGSGSPCGPGVGACPAGDVCLPSRVCGGANWGVFTSDRDDYPGGHAILGGQATTIDISFVVGAKGCG